MIKDWRKCIPEHLDMITHPDEFIDIIYSLKEQCEEIESDYRDLLCKYQHFQMEHKHLFYHQNGYAVKHYDINNDRFVWTWYHIYYEYDEKHSNEKYHDDIVCKFEWLKDNGKRIN